MEPRIRDSIKSGLITQSAIAESDYPKDAMNESLNFHFDTIGKMTLRGGLTQLGDTISDSNILGLYFFVDNAGVYKKLMAVNGTALYYLSGNTWVSKRTGLTSGSKARFTTMLDNVFMVNGTEATAVWDGHPATNFVTTGNASNAPIGKFIDNYRSRIWIAGNPTYPDRIYYSTIPSAVTTPIVSWDTDVGTGQWIDISPSDGENITALKRTRGALLVFKPSHTYRIFSILQADPDVQFNVGTYSQESVVETKNGIYFHSPTGFYRYDGNMVEVSRPIIDIVEAITDYENIAGYVEPDGDHICWSIGDVTYGGTTYQNMVVRYTISTQVWTHYTYPTRFLASSTFVDGNIYTVVGDEDGKVYKTDIGTTDNGSSIFYSLIHPFDSIDGYSSTVKIINKMFFRHSGMTGASITYQIPNDITNDWRKKVGVMKNTETGFSNLNVRGREIKFRISGTSKGEPVSYEGYECLDGSSQLITFT
jgi:hypothetical protein